MPGSKRASFKVYNLSGTKYYMTSTYKKLFILKLFVTACVLRFMLYKILASNVY